MRNISKIDKYTFMLDNLYKKAKKNDIKFDF